MNPAPLWREIRQIEPLARDWQTAGLAGGTLDTAHRSMTPAVEGTIRIRRPLLLVTLAGGAEHVEVGTECGPSFRGRERAGHVSFLPAGCTRTLRMSGVASRWATVAFDDVSAGAPEAFTNRDDPVAFAIVKRLADLTVRDGGVDRDYGRAMLDALRLHLAQADADDAPVAARSRIGLWRLARIRDYVGAHLQEPIGIGQLAASVGLSEGHLSRAFKAETGESVLAYIQRRRIDEACRLLSNGPCTVETVAFQVGFSSVAHFTRLFARLMRTTPAEYGRAANLKSTLRE